MKTNTRPNISIAPKIAEYYNGFKEDNDNIYMNAQKALQDELVQCQKDIDTLVDLILKSPSDVFLERIEKLEVKRDEIRKKITDHELQKCS